MFDTIIVQPIFNLLVFIYGILPGHDFGVAVIVFTIIIRLALWPMVRKQLHNTRALRAIQPEIKKIRKKTKGDKPKEAELIMALYKERGVSPFSAIGGLIIQLPILIGLFQAIQRLINDASIIESFSYDFVANLPFIQSIIIDNSLFDKSFLGIIDLSRQAFEDGRIYVPLMILAVVSGILQYYQTRQLSPDDGERKKLRDILKSASDGKEADQADINAAMARNMRVFFPLMTAFFAATFPGSLALYWTAGSAIALMQNQFVLRGDVEEGVQMAIEDKAAEETEKTQDKEKVAATSAKEKPRAAAKTKSGKAGKKKQSRKSRKSSKKE